MATASPIPALDPDADLEEQAAALSDRLGDTLGDMARVYLMAEDGSDVARRTLVRWAMRGTGEQSVTARQLLALLVERDARLVGGAR